LKILTVFFLLGCKNKSYFNESKDVKEVIEHVNPDKENRVEEFIKRITDEGDLYAYGRLFEVYADRNELNKLLPYTEIMINKFQKCEGLCLDLYYIKIWDYTGRASYGDQSIESVVNIPAKELNSIIQCLEKCGKMGESDSINLLIEYYKYTNDQKNINIWKNKQKNLPKRKYSGG
jgi:hypothetical protein